MGEAGDGATGSERPTLPGTDHPERVVAHVDVDCFYAACERLREPELEGEPVVVAMGYEPGGSDGAVATASYEARDYGVESAMAVSEALDLLPRVEEGGNGHYRPVDMEYYETVAADVDAALEEGADTVRSVSVDEAYLDVTDRTDWDSVEADARSLKRQVADAAGVTASVGVAPTMSAAKVASDREKPDGLVVVRPGEVRAFFADLEVEAIHGVGPVTARELREMGIETGRELAAADPAELRAAFGETGHDIWRRARGIDPRPVEPTGDPKSLSRESAFTDPTDEYGHVRERVRGLATDVARRAAERGARYRTIGIKVVHPPFEVRTRARSLPGPVEDPELLEEVALELLGEFEGTAVRKLGVRVANLEFGAGEQTSLAGFADAEESTDTPEPEWVQTTLPEFT